MTRPVNSKTSMNNSVVKSRRRRDGLAGKRARGDWTHQQPFMPPEDWYEPSDVASTDYRIVVQPPGEGYRHVVTPAEIRERLAMLPEFMIRPLDVVQLSRMTRKKQTYPCYGMQWGSTLYLYPIETSLIEYFGRPPKPNEWNETRMYGGRWVEDAENSWRLIWTEQTIRDYYLNNILIHELGHLLDERNSSYIDRERYAEWFAIEYGYKPSRDLRQRALKKIVRRRHHAD